MSDVSLPKDSVPLQEPSFERLKLPVFNPELIPEGEVKITDIIRKLTEEGGFDKLGGSQVKSRRIHPTPDSQIRVSIKGSGKAEVSKLHELAQTTERAVEVYKKCSDALGEALQSYSRETINSALDAVLSEKPLQFSSMPKVATTKFLSEIEGRDQGMTLVNYLKLMPENEIRLDVLSDLREGEKADFKGTNVDVAKCELALRHCILKEMQWTPKVIHDVSSEGRTQSLITQEVSRGDHIHVKDILSAQGPGQEAPLIDDSKFIKNHAYGSALAKTGAPYAVEVEPHCVNLGSVTSQGSDGRLGVVQLRSGKTDSLETLVELSLHACLQQGKSSQSGFTRSGGALEFRHTLTSYLDFHWIKSKIPGLENERKFLMNMMHAIDAWPAEGIQVKVPVKQLDGSMKIELVALKKPLLTSQLFSPTLFSGGGQEETDKLNFVSNLHLFHEGTKGQAYSPGLKSGFAALEQAMREEGLLDPGEELNKATLDKLSLVAVVNSSLHKSKAYSQYRSAVAAHLLNRLDPSNKADPNYAKDMALFAVMFRRYPPVEALSPKARDALLASIAAHPSTKKVDALHAADLQIYRDILTKKLENSSSVQCKSGKDRTGIGVALSVAQERFERSQKKIYIPMQGKPSSAQEWKDALIFKKLFRDALDEFGIKLTLESTGVSGLKAGPGEKFGINWTDANPVIYKYLFLEEDVAKLASDTLLQHEVDFSLDMPDVTGLTYADLKSGATHYKGTLVNPAAVYGSSLGKYVKMAKKQFIDLTEKDIEKINKALLNCLKGELKFTSTEFDREGVELLTKERCEFSPHMRKQLKPDKVQLEKLGALAKLSSYGGLDAKQFKLFQNAIDSIFIAEQRRLQVAEHRELVKGDSPSAPVLGVSIITARSVDGDPPVLPTLLTTVKAATKTSELPSTLVTKTLSSLPRFSVTPKPITKPPASLSEGIEADLEREKIVNELSQELAKSGDELRVRKKIEKLYPAEKEGVLGALQRVQYTAESMPSDAFSSVRERVSAIIQSVRKLYT